MSRTLRVGYVPEHFSSPILQLAAKDKSIELVSCPSGTGQILAAINAKEIDIGVALTEALITGLVKETAAYKLVGSYTTSPLNWAVAVGKDSKYQKISDLEGEKIGISRIGSGSQVIASYMALKEGWTGKDGKVLDVQFEVLDTFKNLRDGVNDGRAAAFLWEHFTTKPYLSELRFIDHVLSPWSAWTICATSDFLSTPDGPARVKTFLSDLAESIHAFDHPEARKSTSKDFVVNHFKYPEEDVVAWFEGVKYPQGAINYVKMNTVIETLNILVAAGVFEVPEEGWNISHFVDTDIATLE